MVKVLVFGQTLLDSVDEPEMEYTLSEPVTVRALLESHQASLKNLLPFLNSSQLMVTVNQKISTLEALVKNGDTVKLTHQFHPDLEGTLWHNP